MLNDSVFAEDLPDILQHTPNLGVTYMGGSEIGAEFFAALVYDAAPVSLVPQLEILDLYDVAAHSAKESFARMIASQWWSDEERGRMKHSIINEPTSSPRSSSKN
jgi:hypothetical protein